MVRCAEPDLHTVRVLPRRHNSITLSVFYVLRQVRNMANYFGHNPAKPNATRRLSSSLGLTSAHSSRNQASP